MNTGSRWEAINQSLDLNPINMTRSAYAHKIKGKRLNFYEVGLFFKKNQVMSYKFIRQVTILSGKGWRLFCEYWEPHSGNRHGKEAANRSLGRRPLDQPFLPHQAQSHKTKRYRRHLTPIKMATIKKIPQTQKIINSVGTLRNWNSCAPFLRMQNGATSNKNIMVVPALASVALLVRASPYNCKVAGSIPGQSQYLGCGFNPQSQCMESPVQAQMVGN